MTTFTTATTGTLRWMAPELIRPEVSMRKSVQTDVYAFGCVALEVSGFKLAAISFPDCFVVPLMRPFLFLVSF